MGRSMQQDTFEILGVDLDVEYIYTKGIESIDYDTPDDPDECEVFDIFHAGANVTDLLSENVKTLIEEAVCKKYSHF